MSSALDRLAALAAGTAPVVSLRPSARFERRAQVEEPVVVEDEESPVPPAVEPPAVEPDPVVLVPAAEPAPVVLAPAVEPDPVVAAQFEGQPEPALVTGPRRVRAPTAAAALTSVPPPATPGSPPTPTRPQSPPPPAPVSEPPAVRTSPPARGRSAPADVEPPPPDVLLEEHIVPVLVREQVVQRTAVPRPSPRTDVEVVEILGEPRIERVRGEPPQVHVNIGEVRVTPPAPAQPPARPAPPDLDAYLAARREGS